jgi:hypothetical protein
MAKSKDDYIELVGGPFCGALIKATLNDLEPGGTVNTPCSSQKNKKNDAWDHLDAVYLIHKDGTATLIKYVPTEF